MVCAVDAASLRTEASESSVAASHLPSVSPYDAELTKGHEGEHVTPWGCQGNGQGTAFCELMKVVCRLGLRFIDRTQNLSPVITHETVPSPGNKAMLLLPPHPQKVSSLQAGALS